MSEALDLQYAASEDRWCLDVGWQFGRYEFFHGRHYLAGAADDDQIDQARLQIVSMIKAELAAHGLVLHDELSEYQEMSNRLFDDVKARFGGRRLAFLWIGIGAFRASMSANLQDSDKKREFDRLAHSAIMQVPAEFIRDKDKFWAELQTAGIGDVPSLEQFVLRNSSSPVSSPQTAAISVLFVASDPTDQARLRLGEEYREIQQMLSIARLRDRFHLEQRFSTRVGDLTQAILDVQPRIVHFAGHGAQSGELCLERSDGKSQPVSPDALSGLFRLVAEDVDCVILNACYTDIQAVAIAKHIRWVIGMAKAVSDGAAISFVTGFYQALGAGRDIKKAFEFGKVQISLHDLPEDLTPVLLSRD
jgi:CHAT domain-containing protein